MTEQPDAADIAFVNERLGRINKSLGNVWLDITLLDGDRRGASLWLIHYRPVTEPGATLLAHDVLVLIDYRLTSQTAATGFLHYKAGHPRPVGICHRGTGREDGELTRFLPGAAFARAQALATEHLTKEEK